MNINVQEGLGDGNDEFQGCVLSPSVIVEGFDGRNMEGKASACSIPLAYDQLVVKWNFEFQKYFLLSPSVRERMKTDVLSVVLCQTAIKSSGHGNRFT